MENGITRLEVFNTNGVYVYEVGDIECVSNRVIAEIKDLCKEFDGHMYVGYELVDKDGYMLARFENGTYATWFDKPDV